MMTRDTAKNREQIQFVSLDDLVPEEHLVRKLEAAIDWSFIYELVEETYSKELHGFRYTQEYGKARMEVKAALTFACMNLKRLAKKRWKSRLITSLLARILTPISVFTSPYAKNPLVA